MAAGKGFIEAQAELNRYLSGPSGQKIREYKQKKEDAYHEHLKGIWTPSELEMIFTELRTEYGLYLDQMEALFAATRAAYQERRVRKDPEDHILVKLLDGDHPDNPHRKLDELS